MRTNYGDLPIALDPQTGRATVAHGPALPAGGATPAGRYRSKLEAAYAAELAAQQQAGVVRGWRYEALTVRLLSGIRYTPDFVVWRPDGSLELHEVKGWWREDAKLKFREAAAQWPMFRWVVVSRPKGGAWQLALALCASP